MVVNEIESSREDIGLVCGLTTTILHTKETKPLATTTEPAPEACVLQLEKDWVLQ